MSYLYYFANSPAVKPRRRIATFRDLLAGGRGVRILTAEISTFHMSVSLREVFSLLIMYRAVVW